MSQWLDSHLEVIEWVAEDLGSKELKQTGRHGLSVETVLRAGILKQYWQVSYKKLSFHLADSLSCRAFVRLDEELAPKKSSLQAAISAIRDKTWERINRCLLKDAKKEKVVSRLKFLLHKNFNLEKCSESADRQYSHSINDSGTER
jgi:IS5 family transposase